MLCWHKSVKLTDTPVCGDTKNIFSASDWKTQVQDWDCGIIIHNQPVGKLCV